MPPTGAGLRGPAAAPSFNPNFALSSAAVTLRLYIPASVIAGAEFAEAYPVIAWLCWVPNLIVAVWMMRRDVRRAKPA